MLWAAGWHASDGEGQAINFASLLTTIALVMDVAPHTLPPKPKLTDKLGNQLHHLSTHVNLDPTRKTSAVTTRRKNKMAGYVVDFRKETNFMNAALAEDIGVQSRGRGADSWQDSSQ